MTSPRPPQRPAKPRHRQLASTAEPRFRTAMPARAGASRERAAAGAAAPAQLVVGTRLAASLTAPRQARAAVRRVLAAWGMSALSADAELCASELVANATEHAGGAHIDLILATSVTPGGPWGITCEVRDSSPALPRLRPATPGSERGRGLPIIAAIASASGVHRVPGGKAAWFTLTIPPGPAPNPIRSPARHEPEAIAGALPARRQPPDQKESPMTQPPPSNDDQRRTARNAARNAILSLARDAGAELVRRPLLSNSDYTISDVEPLAGMRAARQLELGARETTAGYIRAAREAGYTWHDIGTALHLVPGGDAQQAGDTIAEAAYTYAAGNPGTETARRYGRSFIWTCRSCDQHISDRGLISGPADDEHGHADDCPRLAAAIARWDADWEAGQ